MLHHEVLLTENLYLKSYSFNVYTAVDMLWVADCFTESE